jgi:hypothetical protein
MTTTFQDIIDASQSSKGDVKSDASFIISAKAQGAQDTKFTKIGTSFKNVQDQLNNLRRLTGDFATIVNETTFGVTVAELVALGFGRSLVYQTQLVAGVNALTYASPLYETDSLFVWVRQVASGTVGTITFGSNMKFADPAYVTSTFSLVTIYPFHAFPDPADSNTLKWFCVSPPNAEQTI